MAAGRSILFILLDQLRADCLWGPLAAHVPLPNMRRLADQGVRFDRHYSAANPCGPSRASILTGLYPMTHRSVRNGTPLAVHHPTLPRALRAGGVEPLLYGYTDTAPDPRGIAPADPALKSYEQPMPGFTEVLAMRFEESLPWQGYLRGRGYAPPPYARFFEPVPEPGRPARIDDPAFYAAGDSDTAFLTDRFLEDIAVRDLHPWCALLTYIRPHPPFVAPAPWNRLVNPATLPPPIRLPDPASEAARHPFLGPALEHATARSFVQGIVPFDDTPETHQAMRAVYLGLAAEVDAHVGRVLDWLEASGRAGETLVVLSSDHGEMLGDHWGWGKSHVYEPAWRVPLVIRDPDRPAQAGRVVDAFTSHADLAPTLLDWLGLKVPAAMDGASLLPLLDGPAPRGWRDHVVTDLDFADLETPTVWQRALGLAPELCNLTAIREARWKLVHFNGGLPPLLFDLAADPDEMTDLAADPAHQGEVLRLTRRLLDHRLRHADHALSGLQITSRGVIGR
jgi:arylsulfatase A-like enzyme